MCGIPKPRDREIRQTIHAKWAWILVVIINKWIKNKKNSTNTLNDRYTEWNSNVNMYV